MTEMVRSGDGSMSCDVLVLGSGAAGLTAAVVAAHHGLKVVVAEKSSWFGGTSAISGGWLWIPRNPLALNAGIKEDIEDPLTYLRSEIGNVAGDARIDSFLANGPRMVSFLADHAEMEWIDGNRIPDFHDTPGSSIGGRSVSAAPFDGRRLGSLIERLRPPLREATVWGMTVKGGAEMSHFFNASRSLTSSLIVARRLARFAWHRLRHGRDMHLVNGNALVARLLRSALDKGVTLLAEAPATRLIQEQGRVAGAVLQVKGTSFPIRAARGVVLATGGFPHDPAGLAALVPHAGPHGLDHHSAAPRTNTGEGLRLAEAVGARLRDDLASATAMAPVSLAPRSDGGVTNFPHLVDRAKPGFIAVTPNGRRFVNEADSYYDFIAALLRATPTGAAPYCWLLADDGARRRWGIGAAKPFPFPLRPWQRSGYVRSARSLAELAALCGIDPTALAATVNQFNEAARRGEDPLFGRGSSPYNRLQGDVLNRPNPSLGPLEQAPFHAVRIVPGSLGTFAGLKTDALARVLDGENKPIAGLFAVGNDMSSVMNGRYPSGGITLGPGMTFGFVVGRHLVGLPVIGIEET
ncbi:Succinate dehydrogenase/fumarate reductase, flavoprotein subunit [Rhizobium tibeticum]|uniref:3-oxosteroid 1-dehydrogenase n=1 Tax=Rhizobium tibeticum TaxID=501024 RepID=A0A1H8VZW9_9HYPH|nr:FAD-dependent oxidoreductase [Rhizobium tibeticum]SEI20041.1 3-oxosteroid 1-dehydrogenase [Rhizobium tibeticum]SEP20926.1 Succinate dehydrogenase/fumarate reductase, flavoprotein subunit [Rhizobium tibeticum]